MNESVSSYLISAIHRKHYSFIAQQQRYKLNHKKMTSSSVVKSRILQFQQDCSSASAIAATSTTNGNNCNRFHHHLQNGHSNLKSAGSNELIINNNFNGSTTKNNTNYHSLSPQSITISHSNSNHRVSLIPTKSEIPKPIIANNTNLAQTRLFSKSKSSSNLLGDNKADRNPQLTRKTADRRRDSSDNSFYSLGVDVVTTSTSAKMSAPLVNRASKPKMLSSSGLNKKNSLAINLNPATSSNSPTTPTTSSGVTLRKSSISKSTNRLVGSPTVNNNHSGGFPGSSSSLGGSRPHLYGGIGWKEKFDESEKKRNHLVTLAQKATRDYEELRRRYQDIYSEREKLGRKLDAASTQLDTLRTASEAVYSDFYRLKRKCEVENREKASALSRVDQYNKENRRLKRQSAALMVQINTNSSDPSSWGAAIDEAMNETESVENDKEILYLRNKVQELEEQILVLDGELERAKLAEFEVQENAMLVSDSISSLKAENKGLQDQLKRNEESHRRTLEKLEDAQFDSDTFKGRLAIAEEKLVVVETELRKLHKEKAILQRQSLVFLTDVASDTRLMEALDQIGVVQSSLEEQRGRYESQLEELQVLLADKESQLETVEIQNNARIKSLEKELESMKNNKEAPMPPPAPPPPPPPSSTGLSSGTLGILRNANSHNNGSSPSSSSSKGESPSPPAGRSGQSPVIDDVISQLKKGITLRPMSIDRMSQVSEDSKPGGNMKGFGDTDNSAVEEMRSILNNLRRTRQT